MAYIPLDENNRMFRIGFGKNKGRWFVRIDLWFLELGFDEAKCRATRATDCFRLF
jgi:hypothetical protein